MESVIIERLNLITFMKSKIHLSHNDSFLRELDFDNLSFEHLLQIKHGYNIFKTSDNDLEVGLITGKFAPFHYGHVYAILEAAKQVQKLFVVLSFDQKFVDKQPDYLKDKLTLEKRLMWLVESFKDCADIEVLVIDETNVPRYPDGLQEWCELVYDVL